VAGEGPLGGFVAGLEQVRDDIMRGTGRYNLALGAIATAQGIGASLSGLAAGVIVDHFGSSAAFLALAAAAAVALRLRAWDARNSRPGGGIAAVLSPLLAIPEVPCTMATIAYSSTNGLWSAVLRVTARQTLARREADEDG
jgi:hypothetical protein